MGVGGNRVNLRSEGFRFVFFFGGLSFRFFFALKCVRSQPKSFFFSFLCSFFVLFSFCMLLFRFFSFPLSIHLASQIKH